MNGSGRAPKKLDIDYIRKRGIEGIRIPLTDLNSVTVPGLLPAAPLAKIKPYKPFTGAAAAWADTVEKFGSGKLTLSEVLGPAIRLAEEG